MFYKKINKKTRNCRNLLTCSQKGAIIKEQDRKEEKGVLENLNVQQRQTQLNRKEDFKEIIDMTNEYTIVEAHTASIGNNNITRKHPRTKEWR